MLRLQIRAVKLVRYLIGDRISLFLGWITGVRYFGRVCRFIATGPFGVPGRFALDALALAVYCVDKFVRKEAIAFP